MNIAALRHRPESEDCFLYDQDLLVLRLHTAKGDARRVSLIYGDPYMTVTDAATTTPTWKYSVADMVKVGEGQTDDYWSLRVKMPYHRIQYQFAVEGSDGQHVLLSDRGIRADTAENRLKNNFRVPYFQEVDRVKTPDWAKTTVWYQIFPERFANGDQSNDPQGVKPWNPEDHPGREDFYGGDLQGVLDHLDDLQRLGINGLYFCPIFKASSNHKYDTIDYFDIDPDFGDKDLFERLVNEAHRRGMKVMLDAVFNHIGYQSLQWQDVLKNGDSSRFASWFHINSYPLTPFNDPSNNGGNPQYDTFAFEPHMPKLNTANPDVQDYLLEIATYWIRTFDIDAWRLDVANEVDHHFWRRFYQATQQCKKDFLVIGEVWHSSQPWLNGDQFSGVMNYAFTEQVEEHFLTSQQTAQKMVELLTDQLMMYRQQNAQVMLNTLDSHDTARILTVAGGDEKRALQALAFIFTQTGMPCIYYGTEMGMSGDNDPDCRKPMDWSQLGQPIWQKVHEIVQFRRDYAQLLGTGSTRLSVNSTDLIKVERVGSAHLTAYFNTTNNAVPLSMEPKLAQGYDGENLAPKGFVIEVI